MLTYSFAQTLGLADAARAIVLALGLCALYGLAVEFLAVRPFASGAPMRWLMATVALRHRAR